MRCKSILLILLIGIMAMATGCSLFDNTEPVAPGTLQLLLDAQWDLLGWGSTAQFQSLIEDTRITLDFTSSSSNALKGRINGHGGCNSYFGSFEVNEGKITIRDVGSTKVFCAAPDGVMEQENRFFDMLSSAVGFGIQNGQLEISTDRGERILFIGALP